MDWRNTQFPYPLVFEASADSEDDHNQITAAIECQYNMCYINSNDNHDDDDDNDDDDDAESSSHDFGHVNCVDIQVDDGGHAYDEGDDDDLALRKMGFSNVVLGSVAINREEEEVIEANTALRKEMDAMEDRDFWETCLAIGYP